MGAACVREPTNAKFLWLASNVRKKNTLWICASARESYAPARCKIKQFSTSALRIERACGCEYECQMWTWSDPSEQIGSWITLRFAKRASATVRGQRQRSDVGSAVHCSRAKTHKHTLPQPQLANQQLQLAYIETSLAIILPSELQKGESVIVGSKATVDRRVQIDETALDHEEDQRWL